MPRSRALAPERRLDLLPGNHRGTRSVGCCHTVDTTRALSGLIATKALGSQVVPVLGTTGCASTPARYQTVSGGAKYCSASWSYSSWSAGTASKPSGVSSPLSARQSVSKYEEWPLISNSAIRLVSASARGGSTPPRYVWMTPSLRRTPVPGVWGTEAMGRTLRTLRWSSSMRRARQVATDRRHTFGAAATGRAMRSNQNNSVSVCNRVTMPLTSPGVESEARAITKRKRRLDSGMAVLKLDSWTPLGGPGFGSGVRGSLPDCDGCFSNEELAGIPMIS